MVKMTDAGMKKSMELVFDGEVTIQKIAGLKVKLVAALDETDCLIVNLKDVNRADITFLQLLCSAHQTSYKTGKSLKLVKISDIVMKAATEAGFVRNHLVCGQECSDTCLWKES